LADEVNTTAVIGLLIGFLVVGVIGVYVGESLISATNLTGVSSTTMSNATVGSANTTFPANVLSIDLTLYGGGGGGGAGNNSAGGRGGGAGGQGHETIATGIAISAGQWINYTVGDGGAGGVNASGSTGATTTIVLNGVPYTAAGGVGGGNGTSPNSDGVSGTTGYGASYTSQAGSDGAVGNWGGLAAIGVGAGGDVGGVVLPLGANREQLLQAQGLTGKGVGAHESGRPSDRAGTEAPRHGQVSLPRKGETQRLRNGGSGVVGGCSSQHLRQQEIIRRRYGSIIRLECELRPKIEGEPQAVEAGAEVSRRGGDA
jgi:hypothetical protein